MGAIYVWIVLIVLFTILAPNEFFNYGTVKQVLNEYAVTGLVALGLVMPLSAGLYDLSVGSVAGLSGVMSAWALAHVGASPWVGIVAGLVVALAAGALNVLVVIVMRVDSFIGTLATSSIAGAVVVAISGDNPITKNVGGAFATDLGEKSVAGLTLPVALVILAVLVLAFVLERSTFGRKTYATGYDTEVARLGGVNVGGLRATTLVVSALLAGLAGICEAASLGAGDPTVGPSYLLPAFAAAFLGATQFRAGRFNPWGCVVAVLLLGTADVGLLIVGAPTWTPSVFEGCLLIVAVALTHAQGMNTLRSLRRRTTRGDRDPGHAVGDGGELLVGDASTPSRQGAGK